MTHLTSYVPTDTKGLVITGFLVSLTISCCNLGEIHGFQGKDEEVTQPLKLHQIRKKDTPEKPSSSATGRIHALEGGLLPPNRSVQSPTGRGNVSSVRINRGNNPAPVWQMHRLSDRQIEAMGNPLHARGFTPLGQRIYNAYVQSRVATCGPDTCSRRLSEFYETATQALRTTENPVLPMR